MALSMTSSSRPEQTLDYSDATTTVEKRLRRLERNLFFWRAFGFVAVVLLLVALWVIREDAIANHVIFQTFHP